MSPIMFMLSRLRSKDEKRKGLCRAAGVSEVVHSKVEKCLDSGNVSGCRSRISNTKGASQVADASPSDRTGWGSSGDLCHPIFITG